MRFKIIGIIIGCTTWLSATYIDDVYINHFDNEELRLKIIAQFKHQITDNHQLDRVFKSLIKTGTIDKISHSLKTTDGVTLLRIEILQTPIITRISYLNSPLSSPPMAGLYHHPGRRLNYDQLKKDIDIINQYLVQKGYVLASIKSASITKSGDLKIEIESPKLRSIQISGLKKTPASVVYREITSLIGKPMDQHLLNIDYESLSRLPYFSSVSPPQINISASSNVTVFYTVKEQKINRIDIGLEQLEQKQGIALFSKLKWHNTLIYSDFLLLQFQLGYLNNFNLRTTLINYQQPWILNKYQFILDTKLFRSYQSEFFQGIETPYNTQRNGGSIFIIKPIKLLSIETGAGFRREHVIPQISGDFSSYYLNLIRTYVEINHVKNELNPKAGYRSKLIIDNGGHIFGISFGGVDFSRVSASHAQYTPLTHNLTLATRLFAGVYNKQTPTPVFESEKFSFGGANSLRSAKEFAFYGRYRLSLNVETRFQINPMVMVVAFIDTGYISDAIQSLTSELKWGYGIGGRYLNPIIPIRLDIGFGKEVIAHLSIAQAF
jgi:outer membrane protein insertion porin family